MKKKHYQIWKLPEQPIVIGAKVKCDRKNDFFKLREDLFPKITETLKVRPNAKKFFYKNLIMGNLPLYAVLCCSEEKTECLYIFKIVHSSFSGNISEIALCRCIGKHQLKKHNEIVRKIILGNVDIIEGIKEKDYCSFIF